MIPMIAMLVDTAVAFEENNALNYVHEWGVVVFEQGNPIICGSPLDGTAVYRDYDMCAEAPVVWIHGEPFTDGTFTVRVWNGEALTILHPDPDILTENKATWNISAGYDLERSIEETALYSGSFSWAMDYWRDVPSLPLYQNNTGITEKFLYYECTVNPEFTGNFFYWNSNGNPVFTGTSIEEALFFTPYGVIPISVQLDEFIPCDFPLGGEIDPELAPDTFCRWADSRLKSSEISALWETWQPALTEEGSYWLVFPIPVEYNNEISTIRLETSAHRDIEYERLFLGAIRLNR
ncbi:MAG: hypothetical protein K8S62_01900 [Candidatus Sabulitectum sp.]|nr:hypothetical protein [Candidatus Sabulitectum sp.]